MVITINKPELDWLIKLSRKRRPGLEDIYVWSCLNGWATVDVPNWKGSRADLYSLTQGRIYGPESYQRRTSCSNT